MHCVPYDAEASRTSSGFCTAAVLIDDLVGAGVEQPAHVVDLAHAAADGERDEDLRRHRLDDVQDDVALVARSR